MATLTAGGIKAAQSGSDAPLCLKVCRVGCAFVTRSRTRCTGAVVGAGGRQEALQVSRVQRQSKLTLTPENSAELSDGAESLGAVLSDDAFTVCQAGVAVGTVLRLTQYTVAAPDGKTCARARGFQLSRPLRN